MKNLSFQEKKDLDQCVFNVLSKKEMNFFQILFLKIKSIFYSK
ncbi:hypothetical protein CNZW441b_0767 [Campylobacter novaezeelandiae]|nr:MULTISPECIES: hypothetical protein [Campylobacter]QWU80084.1 hypothetical protein CNZW441b_0767 [Campylobacter novaezeelandiae]